MLKKSTKVKGKVDVSFIVISVYPWLSQAHESKFRKLYLSQNGQSIHMNHLFSFIAQLTFILIYWSGYIITWILHQISDKVKKRSWLKPPSTPFTPSPPFLLDEQT